MQGLVKGKILTKAQGDAVDCEGIAEFFNSELGKRMKNAVRRETEFSFYTKDTADNIYGRGGDHEILLQGTMDCFFVEKDGRTVLLDYKTDKVKTRETAEIAAKRYSVQMKYYKKALTEILEKPVDECYLYFMACGEFVKVD